MTNQKPNALKSPYFRNALEADDFEDRVHTFKNKPHIIAVAFDTDPKEGMTSFEIATKSTQTEQDMLQALLYVIERISEQKGLIVNINVRPMNQPTPEILELVRNMFQEGRIIFKRPPEDGLTPIQL